MAGPMASVDDYVSAIFEIKRKVYELEAKVNEIAERVSRIEGIISTLQSNRNNTLNLIIKYVIFPLIVVISALAGVKLYAP